MAPGVSVIIPVYNRAHFLEPAIASVREQQWPNVELIIIDDGSSDGSAELARQLAPEALLIERENGGPGAARNSGLAVATGDYIAFLDVDDLWPNDKLSRQIARLESDHSLDFIVGRIQLDLMEGGQDMGVTYEEPDAMITTFFQFGAGLFRSHAFAAAGPISETLKDSEDHDWFLRAKEAGLSWTCEQEIGLIYRRHPGNMTQPRPLNETSLFQVIASSLSRRRAAAGTAAVPPLDRLSDRRFGEQH